MPVAPHHGCVLDAVLPRALFQSHSPYRLLCGPAGIVLYEGELFQPADSALATVTLQNFVPAWHRAIQYPLFVLFAFIIAWTTIDIPRNSLKAVVAAGALLQLVSMVWLLRLHGIFFSPCP